MTSAQMVKELRERTGAGVMDCKAALEASSGDFDAAVEFLRKKGLASAAKKQGREAKDGVVLAYIHPGSKLGVLIEVNCETDFVARTADFQQLVKDLAMQVAGVPTTLYVAREEVPGSIVEQERTIYRDQMANEKKPANVIDKIVEGKLEKFFAEACLLEQPWVRDSSGKTRMKDLVDEATSKMGERVVVKRFSRFQVGG